MRLDVATIVSVITALGVGSVIGQWFATSKDRRTTRAAVLKKLAAVEEARWYQDGPEVDNPRLAAAIRQLETAALIARIPRAAVRQYAQLATAALWISQLSMDLTDYGSISMDVSDTVRDAAEIVSNAAWSPMTRWLWLRWRMHRVERKAAVIEDDPNRAPESPAAEEAKLIKRARKNVR